MTEEETFGFDEAPEDITPDTTPIETPDIEIPDIDLEDYEVPEDEETAIEDEAGGSQVFAWIGSGQGGGRLAKAFYDRGYRKCIAVNTSSQDLDTLDLPKAQKLLLDIGEQGAGKDMTRGEEAANKYKQHIFDLMRKIYGGTVDHLFVCIGAGGGTGGCGGSLGLSRDRDRSRGTSTITVSGSQ